MNRKKIIFLPVSGPKGSGEYIRSLAVAQGISQTWKNVQIQFIINRNAVYAGTLPFKCHLIDRSPTLEPKAVKNIIKKEKPDLCIFDSSGRTSVFRTLKKMGTPIVFISSRKRPRRKAFSPKWLPYITQHWIAQPAFAAGPLTKWEQLKLKITRSDPPYFLETLFPIPNDEKRAKLKNTLAIGDEPYIVFSSGGGGKHNQKGKQAPEIFAEAASIVAQKSGKKCIAVMGPNYNGRLPEHDGVILVPAFANDEFIELIHDAEILVIGGGSIIAQGLANKKVCVAIPTAGDQHARIQKAEELQVIVSSDLDGKDISKAVLMLLEDKKCYKRLQEKVNTLNIKNGLPDAIQAVSLLLNKN